MSDAGKGAAGAVLDKTSAGTGTGTGAGAGDAATRAAAAAGAGKGTGADAGKGASSGTGAGAGKAAGSMVDAALAGADKGGAGDGAGDGDGGAAAASWPADWRDQIAGGDAKLGGLLKRYSDPGAVARALGALRTRLDSGEFKKGLPDNATETEIAAFRKDNGIPDKPDGYEIPKGIEVLDVDQPIIDAYREQALKNNIPPGEVQRNLSFFYEAREMMAAQVNEADAFRKAESEDILRQAWGPEYRGNVNGTKAWIVSQTSEQFYDDLMGARMKNGKLIGNDADAWQFLVSQMKELNPTGTLVPSGEQSMKGLNNRIEELEAMQRGDEKTRKLYFSDDKYSKELMGLYDQRDKHAKRNSAA